MIWRGEIYGADLGRPAGHEPGFVRPAVVVSVDILNNGLGGLVVVVPLSSRAYGLRSHIEVEPVGVSARPGRVRRAAVNRAGAEVHPRPLDGSSRSRIPGI